MSTSTQELREFTLLISQVSGLGPVTYGKLIDDYQGVENVYEAFKNEDLDTNLMRSLMGTRPNRLDDSLQRHHISFVCVWEDEYPYLLKHVPDAPVVLFYKGEIAKVNSKNLISIVGSRKLTNEATKWTKGMVTSFVDKGWGVVSGMAMGIDAIAHEAAMAAGGFTLAVLPSPLDNPLPVTNEYLFRNILEQGGCVVSEYAPGTNLSKGMFAARNRIVAGISKATLVTLAGEGSGSLITAACAFDYGREVFALPGNASQLSMKGCNGLIKSGKAKLVEDVRDVLIEFDQWSDEQPVESTMQVLAKNVELEPELKSMYEQLAVEPLSADELVPKVDRSITDVISLLMRLQLKGLVKPLDNDKFIAVI